MPIRPTLLPPVLKRSLLQLERWLNKRRRGRQCNICGHTFGHFYPYRGGSASQSDFLRKHNMIEGDLDQFQCPWCLSHDRERHLFMYFDTLGLWEKLKGGGILHIAPERHLSKAIQEQGPASYIKGDLMPATEDTRQLDLTNLPFDDSSFDAVLCCHVLEHIPEDCKAMAEIYRVLKKGGWAILQTPYAANLGKSLEDPAIQTEAERLYYYGQEDHVRLYGRDLFTRLEETGFKLNLHSHYPLLAGFDSKMYGVNPKEGLIRVLR